MVIATANAATTNTGDFANAIALINNNVAINSEIYGSIFINKRRMKYLVVKAIVGFGDRIESLKMYIDYALKHNLIVHIDWKDSVWSHGNESFYKYFQLTDLKQVFSIGEIPTDVRVFPTFWQNNLHTNLTDNMIRNNYKELELNKLEGTYDCDVLVVTSYGIRTIYNDYSFFYNRFKVVDSRISQEVLQRQTTYNLQDKWGIHLRGSDRAKTYDYKLRRFMELNIKLVNNGILTGHKCIAVSDDPDYIRLWKSRYPNFEILSSGTKSSKASHLLTKDELKETKDEMNINLLIDFFTLASCKRVFSTNLDSRFALEAQRTKPFINRIL
jgi:hypothetical protein